MAGFKVRPQLAIGGFRWLPSSGVVTEAGAAVRPQLLGEAGGLVVAGREGGVAEAVLHVHHLVHQLLGVGDLQHRSKGLVVLGGCEAPFYTNLLPAAAVRPGTFGLAAGQAEADQSLGAVQEGQGEEEAHQCTAQGKRPRGPPGGVDVGGDN